MSQEAILAIVGAVLSLVIQLIKKATGIEGTAAMWLTYALSVIAAVGISIFTGAVGDVPAEPVAFGAWLGEAFAIVLATASVVYGLLLRAETRVVAQK
jgi:drug/metabolite transporter (DMT)-like permease